jgi:Icc-related predicted phosphoesterase
MKILAIADVHGTDSAQAVVNEQIKKHSPDLILVCGDITQFGPPQWAKKFLNSIPITTLALPGNCDPEGVIGTIEESKAILLHGKKEEIQGITFVGFGGSNPTPFGTPMEFTEDEIFSGLNEIMIEKAVLAVHAPPKGHLDKTSSRGDLGSRGVADIVRKYSPKLVISAHIHESRGVEKDENTTFVNPGPASKGFAALIDLNDDINVELIEG